MIYHKAGDLYYSAKPLQLSRYCLLALQYVFVYCGSGNFHVLKFSQISDFRTLREV